MSLFGRALAAAGAVGLLTVAPALPGLGATPSGAGWWSTAPASPADLSGSGAVAGPGELQVSASPAGATAVSAVRFQLDPGEEPTALTVKIASGVGREVAVVVACPASSGWTPVEGGRQDQAPKAACEQEMASSVPLADGTLKFAVDAGWTAGDVLDVVLAPGATDVGGRPVTPSFSLVLTAPTAAELATVQTGDPVAFEPDPSSGGGAGAFDPGPMLEPAADAPFDGGGAGPGSSDLGALDSSQTAAEPAPLPEEVRIVPAPGVPLGPARRTSSDDGTDTAQRFGMVLFPLAVLGAIWALNSTSPALRGIGRLAHAAPGGEGSEAPRAGGLARFRRDRDEPAVPLR